MNEQVHLFMWGFPGLLCVGNHLLTSGRVILDCIDLSVGDLCVYTGEDSTEQCSDRCQEAGGAEKALEIRDPILEGQIKSGSVHTQSCLDAMLQVKKRTREPCD